MIAEGQATITRYTPHCVGWARAVASLWGHADDHDLDEPVRLTEEVPVRLRYSEGIVIDRKLTLKTLRAGHHAAMRFYFKGDKWIEIEIRGVHSIDATALSVEMNPCS
jgi:hypothetical protein